MWTWKQGMDMEEGRWRFVCEIWWFFLGSPRYLQLARRFLLKKDIYLIECMHAIVSGLLDGRLLVAFIVGQNKLNTKSTTRSALFLVFLNHQDVQHWHAASQASTQEKEKPLRTRSMTTNLEHLGRYWTWKQTWKVKPAFFVLLLRRNFIDITFQCFLFCICEIKIYHG